MTRVHTRILIGVLLVMSVHCSGNTPPEAQGAGGQGGQAQGGGGQGGSVNTCELPEPNALWSRAFDTPGANFSRPLVDANGNIVLTGLFGTSISFGATTLNSNNGVPTIFLAKLDEVGDTLWARIVDGLGEQVRGGLTLDKSGHLWMAGGFYHMVDFGGSPLTSDGSYTGFLASLDAATGNHVSSKRFGEGIAGVATDPVGNVFVFGYFDQTIDLGGGPLISAGGNDFFVAKLDPTGKHLWSKRFGDASWQDLIVGEVDAMGNVWLAGVLSGNVDFGGGPLNAPGGRAFVAKLDSAGNHILSKTLGSGSIEQIRVGGDGSAVLMGGGDIDFGGGPLAGLKFIAKLDPQGDYLWSRDFGVTMTDRIFDISADANGNVVALGVVQSPMDLADCPHVGQPSRFLSKFAADGTHLWTRSTSASVTSQVVTFDHLGRVLVAGSFKETVDFGAGPLVSDGSVAGFLARFPP